MILRPLSKQLKKIAENELNEVESRVENDIRHIQNWMEKQPHLDFKIDDQLVLSFLRCSKFSLERTKEKIDNYFSMRTLFPEIFSPRDPFLPELQLLLNAGVMVPLPKPAEDGSRILLSTYSNNLDPDTMSLENLAKVCYMIVEILAREDDHTIIGGLKCVMACKGARPKYVPQLTPTFIKQQTFVVGQAPFRLPGVYFLDCPQIFYYAYDLAKRFIPKDLAVRMAIFSEKNRSEVYTKISQELLPEELGGSNGSIKELTIEWKRKVESYREWFFNDENCKSNEQLRPGKPRTLSDVFGTDGSFRQLDID